MTKMNYCCSKAIFVFTIVGILFTASGLSADERLPASEVLSEGTKDFLSDRARTGSLLGSILAGAAVANPLAPLLGSVAGFMIGKSSAFSNKDSGAARRNAYRNRSLIPEDGVEVSSLTGLTGKPPQAPEPTVIVGLSGNPGTGNQLEQAEQIVIVGMSGETETRKQPKRNDQIVIVGSPEHIGTGNQSEQIGPTVSMELAGETGAASELQKQLAYACSNVRPTEPMSLRCYYYSR